MTDNLCHLEEKQFVNGEVGKETWPATGAFTTVLGKSKHGHQASKFY